jgi:hypothetical protein
MNECVQRGIKLLDEKCPSWRTRINLNNLNMVANCILVQVFGDYKRGLMELGLAISRGNNAPDWSDAFETEKYGFTIADCPWDARKWNALTDEWKRQLNETAPTLLSES